MLSYRDIKKKIKCIFYKQNWHAESNSEAETSVTFSPISHEIKKKISESIQTSSYDSLKMQIKLSNRILRKLVG